MLRIADAEAVEGQNLVFTVELDRAATAQVKVDYATSDGTATSHPNATDGADYMAASGSDAHGWSEWAHMNSELAEVLVGAGGVTFLAWIVWETKASIDRRRKRATAPAGGTPNMTQSVNIYAKRNGQATKTCRVGRLVESGSMCGAPINLGRYDADKQVIYLNTVHRPLSISTRNPKVTISDLTSWLDKNGILAPMND